MLGLDSTASWREVKAAYKRLALSLHPDKQRGATAEQSAAIALQFQAVAEAHDILTNEAQRAAYDKLRDYMVSCTWMPCDHGADVHVTRTAGHKVNRPQVFLLTVMHVTALHCNQKL